MAITAAQLISKAARAARIPGIENDVDPSTQSLGLEILNDIFDQIGGAASTIPNQTEVTFSTVAGKDLYTNGVGAFDINTFQIMSVMQMFLSPPNSDVRYYMTPMNEQMNANLGAPENSGIPRWFLMRKLAGEQTTFRLFPVPDQAYTVTIIAKQRLANVTFTTELSIFPREWTRAFKWWMASEYRDYFGMDDSPTIIAKAQEAQRMFKDMNAIDMSVQKDDWIDGRRSFANWATFTLP